MKFTQKQVIILLGGIVLVALVIFGFYYVTKKPVVGPSAKLSIWGTDSAAAMNDLAAYYMGLRSNVTVTYTQVDPSQYEAKLLQALAAGTGPDIFEIGNRALPRWRTALAPMPTSTYGGTFTPALIQQYFPSVVANDFIASNGAIYGLPLSIDTLVMFYNKDDFDSAAIAFPPTTWDGFDGDIAKLRQTDPQGNITRAAVALGGTRASYAHANDMLSLLMLQNGITMVSSDHRSASFANNIDQAASAVNFYLQFSNANSPYFTWNDSMGNALQSFSEGNSAVYFGYYAELGGIKAKAPFLNIGVAPMPQPSGATVTNNYANYLGLVAAKTGNTAYAWDFILATAGATDGENAYIKSAKVPAAQRTAIATQESDQALGVFAEQTLSARSWYEADDQQVDATFDAMLKNVLSGSLDVPSALRRAEDSVTGMLQGS